jgi:hypothetical protein
VTEGIADIHIHQGKTRAALDPLLREIAARGPEVSPHPDVILKMGVNGRSRTASFKAEERVPADRSRCELGPWA